MFICIGVWKEMKRCATFAYTSQFIQHVMLSFQKSSSYHFLIYIFIGISIHNPTITTNPLSQRIYTIQRYISNIIYSSSTMMKNASLPYLQTLKMIYAITWSLQPNHSSDGKYVQRVHSQRLNLCVNWHCVPILELLRI